MAELYLLTSPKGLQYVGVTKNTAAWRFQRHCSDALQNNSCRFLGNTIRKYGPENFTVQTLVVGTFKYVLGLEQAAILAFNTMAPNGYNLRGGGQGGEMSSETRQLISRLAKERHEKDPSQARCQGERMRGSKHSDKTREKMRQVHSTPETKARARRAQLGSKKSEEAKAKMSASAKNRKPFSEEMRKRMSVSAKKRGMPRHVIEAAIKANSRPQSEARKLVQSIRIKQWWVDRKVAVS